eukprot:jgi/Botrbrau1/1814/Bobra.146_1s0012.1
MRLLFRSHLASLATPCCCPAFGPTFATKTTSRAQGHATADVDGSPQSAGAPPELCLDFGQVQAGIPATRQVTVHNPTLFPICVAWEYRHHQVPLPNRPGEADTNRKAALPGSTGVVTGSLEDIPQVAGEDSHGHDDTCPWVSLEPVPQDAGGDGHDLCKTFAPPALPEQSPDGSGHGCEIDVQPCEPDCETTPIQDENASSYGESGTRAQAASVPEARIFVAECQYGSTGAAREASGAEHVPLVATDPLSLDAANHLASVQGPGGDPESSSAPAGGDALAQGSGAVQQTTAELAAMPNVGTTTAGTQEPLPQAGSALPQPDYFSGKETNIHEEHPGNVTNHDNLNGTTQTPTLFPSLESGFVPMEGPSGDSCDNAPKPQVAPPSHMGETDRKVELSLVPSGLGLHLRIDPVSYPAQGPFTIQPVEATIHPDTYQTFRISFTSDAPTAQAGHFFGTCALVDPPWKPDAPSGISRAAVEAGPAPRLESSRSSLQSSGSSCSIQPHSSTPQSIHAAFPCNTSQLAVLGAGTLDPRDPEPAGVEWGPPPAPMPPLRIDVGTSCIIPQLRIEIPPPNSLEAQDDVLLLDLPITDLGPPTWPSWLPAGNPRSGLTQGGSPPSPTRVVPSTEAQPRPKLCRMAGSGPPKGGPLPPPRKPQSHRSACSKPVTDAQCSAASQSSQGTVILTNTHMCAVRYRLSASPPFAVVWPPRGPGSAPTVQQQGKQAARPGGNATSHDPCNAWLVLPAGSSTALRLGVATGTCREEARAGQAPSMPDTHRAPARAPCWSPRPPWEAGKQAGIGSVWQCDGQLEIHYGDAAPQAVRIRARSVLPEIVPDRSDLSFGKTHPGAPRALPLVLSNPTPVEAEWAAEILHLEGPNSPPASPQVPLEAVPWGGSVVPGPTRSPAGETAGARDSKPRLVYAAQDGLPQGLLDPKQRCSAYSTDVLCGVLPPRGLGPPPQQQLKVWFRPEGMGPHRGQLRIHVKHVGCVTCDLSGQGTFDESVADS